MGSSRKNCLLGVTLVLLSATGVSASPFTITTTGTITSSDQTGIVIAIARRADVAPPPTYVLAVTYSGLGAAYQTDGGGNSASDLADMIPASVVFTVDGVTMSTALTVDPVAALSETRSSLSAAVYGGDATGNGASLSQRFGSASAAIPFADLQTGFSYQLTGNDSGVDTYSFYDSNAGIVYNYTGAEDTITLTVANPVPEPATWSMLAFGLAGLALISRRPG